MQENPTLNQKPSRKHKSLIIPLIFTFIIITAFFIYFLLTKPSEEKINYFEGAYPILFEGQQAGNGVLKDQMIYIPLEFVQTVLPDLLIFDSSSQSYIMTTKTDVIQLKLENNEFLINREKDTAKVIPLIEAENDIYMAIDWLQDYYPVEFSQHESGVIKFELDNSRLEIGEVKGERASDHDLRLRSSKSYKSPYFTDVLNGEKVLIEKKNEDYYFVRKESGEAGFIKAKFIESQGTETITVQSPKENYKLIEVPNSLFLTWEAVYTYNPNTDHIPEMAGLNIVSPTWFHLENETGQLSNLASSDYVHWAKNKGYQVWALFSNNFDPELTKKALSNFETRSYIVDQLVQYVRTYQLDGINFDIENVNEEDGIWVTQLMKEAAPLLHREGVIVSMDITFISTSGNWSKFYEREKLATIVDYLMVMAYDEHPASSQIAGSVASLPWVEDNLERLLQVVPAEKLILGIPFYTRLWTETRSETGEVKVSSQALTMEQATTWMTEREIAVSYDEFAGQNYVEWADDSGTVYKMWLEDQTSLRKRAELAREYDLAGIATWSRYFANEEAWSYLNEFYVSEDRK